MGVGFFSRDMKIVSELCFQHKDDCPSRPDPKGLSVAPPKSAKKKRQLEVERCSDCPHSNCGACSEVAGDLNVIPREDE